MDAALNHVSPPFPAVVPAAPPAPIETHAVPLAARPVTLVDLEYAPPPEPPAVIPRQLPPPPPMTSTEMKDEKSAGTVKVVPEVMNTTLVAIVYSDRDRGNLHAVPVVPLGEFYQTATVRGQICGFRHNGVDLYASDGIDNGAPRH